MSNSVHDSLDRLGDNARRFGEELLRDLDRRHPHVLGPAAETLGPDTIVAALRWYVGEPEVDESTDEIDRDALDLSDAIMKTFALVLGRSGWKPAMALAWHDRMGKDGGRLVRALRGKRSG